MRMGRFLLSIGLVVSAAASAGSGEVLLSADGIVVGIEPWWRDGLPGLVGGPSLAVDGLDPDPFDWPEPPDWLTDPDISTPSLPGFEIQHVPWSEVGNIKEGISQLRVKPSAPKSSDEVSRPKSVYSRAVFSL